MAFGFKHQINYYIARMICGIVIILSIFASMQTGRAEENLPQIEDMCYSNARNALYSFAVSYDYVVETFGSHAEEDAWVCDRYDIRIKGLHEKEFRLIETVHTSWMHVYSDGNLFYILESNYLSYERYYDEVHNGVIYPFDLGVGVLNPDTMKIDWHETLYFDISDNEAFGMSDTLLAGDKLCLIFEDEIVVYDTKERILKTIYTTDVPLVNDLWENHAAFYNNRIYVLNEDSDMIAVNIETGNATIMAQDVSYSVERSAYSRHQYYMYDRELWRKTSSSNKVMLEAFEPPVMDDMLYSYIIYKNESEVYLNLNGLYFRYVPETGAYYLFDIADMDLMELMINDVIKRQK